MAEEEVARLVPSPLFGPLFRKFLHFIITARINIPDRTVKVKWRGGSGVCHHIGSNVSTHPLVFCAPDLVPVQGEGRRDGDRYDTLVPRHGLGLGLDCRAGGRVRGRSARTGAPAVH